MTTINQLAILTQSVGLSKNCKRGALSDHQRRIGLCGVAPLINQCGEA